MSQASDPPLIFKQGAGLLNQVQFWWRPPLRTYGIGISTYTLSCPELNYNMQFQSKAITAVIPIANNGVDYYFNITATNVYGLTSNPAYFNRVSAGVRPDIISTISVNLVSSFYATIRWTTVPSIPYQQSVHSYLVYAVPASGGSTIRFANYVTANSYDFIGYPSSYYFFVRAVGTGALFSRESPSTAVIAMGIPPGPPGNITTGVLDPNTVTISWDDDGTTTDYEFEIIPDDGSSPFKVVPSTINGKTATFPGCGGWIGYPTGPGYVIRIICIGGGGLTSSDSAPVYFGSKPPSNVTYADVKASSFTLVWYGAEGANNFQFSLDRGSTIINNDWSPVPYGSSVVGSTIFTGLHIGSSFSGAVVYALNFNSSIITASRPPYSSFVLRPGDIGNLEPSFISQSSFTLNWTGVGTASSIVYGGAQPTSTNGVLGPSVFTGLSTGTTYTISLTPMDPAGPGNTTSITIETVATPVSKITQGDGSLSTLSISWDGTLGSDYYVPLVNGVYGLPVSNYLSSVVITDLEPDTLYNIAIVTYQNVWSTTYISTVSDYITFRTAPAVPAPPTISSLEDDSFVMTWPMIPGTTYSYILNGVLYSPAYSPLTVSSLAANTDYSIILQATNAGGTTGSSTITLRTPPRPASGLGVSSIKMSSFTLTWTGAQGTSTFLFSLDNGISYTDAVWYPNPYGNATGGYAVFDGLESGKQFAGLIIYSINKGGTSSSVALSSLTLLPGPATNMTPSLISPSSFTLSWTGVAGAASLTYLGNVPPTYTNDVLGPAIYTDLAAGSYYSTIIITNNSPGSGFAASTLMKTTPDMSSTVTQSSGAWSTINISWPAATGAERYGYILGDLYTGPIYNSTVTFISLGGLIANTTYSTAIVGYDIVWPETGLVGSTLSNFVNLTTGPQFPILSVSQVSISTFVVNWTVIGNCTYAITGSLVRSGITAPYTVSSLVANTTYNYTVIATNVYGVTPSSFSITTGPTQPQNLSYSNLTYFSYQINWTDGVAATSYTYYNGGVVVSALTDNGVSGRNATFSDLLPNTSYTMVIAAVNVNGINPSVPYTLKTGPGPTTNMVISGVTAYAFTLSWTGAEGVSSYTFHWGANLMTVNAATTTSPYTISSLASNTFYPVYVETTNNLANTSSAHISFTSGPGAPTGISVSGVTAFSYAVSWGGADGASSLTFHYNNSTLTVPASTPSPYTISSLAVNTSYTIWMEATNSVCTTSSLTSASQKTGPGPTTGLVVSGVNAYQFTVAWSGAEGVSSFTFHWGPNSITVNAATTPSPYTISSLASNTFYPVYVETTNSIANTSSAQTSFTSGPGAPTGLSIGYVTAYSFAVFWGGAGGASSLTFRYGGSLLTVPASTPSPYFISSLAFNTTYNVLMEATNSISNTSSLTNLNQTTGPGPATGITIGSVTYNTFTIGWGGTQGATSLTFNAGGISYTVASSTPSPYTFTGVYQNSTYTVSIDSINYLATTSSQTVSVTTGPGPATGLVISGVNAYQFTVAWGGAEGVSSYTFHWGPNLITVNAATTPSPYTISSLASNTFYPVYLDTTNSIANTSSALTSFTSGPGPATGISIGSITFNTFAISWGGAQGATSLIFKAGGISYTVGSSTPSPYTFTGVSQNSTYIVSIDSINNIATTSSQTVSVLTAPAAPNPTFVSATTTSFIIQWTSYTGVTYTYSSNGASGSVTSPHTVTGLTAGQAYTYTLRATNASGTYSTMITASAAPEPATNITLTNAGSDTLTISWSGGSGSTSIIIYVDGQAISVPGGTTTYTITGLQPGKEYIIYIVTTNSAGQSTTSSTVRFSTSSGGGVMAAYGQNNSSLTLAYSPDGFTNWQNVKISPFSATDGNNVVNKIVTNGKVWAAASRYNSGFSIDGVKWFASSGPGGTSDPFGSRYAYGNGLWMMVNNNNDGGDGGYIGVYDDAFFGVSYLSNLPGGYNGRATAVAFCNGVFVVGAGNLGVPYRPNFPPPTLFWSKDGREWTGFSNVSSVIGTYGIVNTITCSGIHNWVITTGRPFSQQGGDHPNPDNFYLFSKDGNTWTAVPNANGNVYRGAGQNMLCTGTRWFCNKNSTWSEEGIFWNIFRNNTNGQTAYNGQYFFDAGVQFSNDPLFSTLGYNQVWVDGSYFNNNSETKTLWSTIGGNFPPSTIWSTFSYKINPYLFGALNQTVKVVTPLAAIPSTVCRSHTSIKLQIMGGVGASYFTFSGIPGPTRDNQQSIDRTVEFENLTPGTTYNIQITANNFYGSSSMTYSVTTLAYTYTIITSNNFMNQAGTPTNLASRQGPGAATTYTSYDGTTFNPIPWWFRPLNYPADDNRLNATYIIDPLQPGSFDKIAYNGRMWIAGANSDPNRSIFWVSYNGVSWDLVPITTKRFINTITIPAYEAFSINNAPYIVNNITWGNDGQWIASITTGVGNGRTYIFKSPDGLVWTTTHVGPNIISMAWGNGTYVYLTSSNDPARYTSSLISSYTWTTSYKPTGTRPTIVKYAPFYSPRFFLMNSEIANTYGGASPIYWSDDTGTNWNRVNVSWQQNPNGYGCMSLCTEGGAYFSTLTGRPLFLAATNGQNFGCYIYSTDGFNWTDNALWRDPLNTQISSNAISVFRSATMRSITWAGDHFIAYDQYNGTIGVSYDGHIWSTLSSVTSTLIYKRSDGYIEYVQSRDIIAYTEPWLQYVTPPRNITQTWISSTAFRIEWQGATNASSFAFYINSTFTMPVESTIVSSATFIGFGFSTNGTSSFQYFNPGDSNQGNNDGTFTTYIIAYDDRTNSRAVSQTFNARITRSEIIGNGSNVLLSPFLNSPSIKVEWARGFGITKYTYFINGVQVKPSLDFDSVSNRANYNYAVIDGLEWNTVYSTLIVGTDGFNTYSTYTVAKTQIFYGPAPPTGLAAKYATGFSYLLTWTGFDPPSTMNAISTVRIEYPTYSDYGGGALAIDYGLTDQTALVWNMPAWSYVVQYARAYSFVNQQGYHAVGNPVQIQTGTIAPTRMFGSGIGGMGYISSYGNLSSFARDYITVCWSDGLVRGVNLMSSFTFTLNGINTVPSSYIRTSRFSNTSTYQAIFTGLTPGTRYTTIITAYDSLGSSNYSWPIDAATMPDPPTNPVILSATETEFTIGWSGASQAETYRFHLNDCVVRPSALNIVNKTATFSNLNPGCKYRVDIEPFVASASNRGYLDWTPRYMSSVTYTSSLNGYASGVAYNGCENWINADDPYFNNGFFLPPYSTIGVISTLWWPDTNWNQPWTKVFGTWQGYTTAFGYYNGGIYTDGPQCMYSSITDSTGTYNAFVFDNQLYHINSDYFGGCVLFLVETNTGSNNSGYNLFVNYDEYQLNSYWGYMAMRVGYGNNCMNFSYNQLSTVYNFQGTMSTNTKRLWTFRWNNGTTKSWGNNSYGGGSDTGGYIYLNGALVASTMNMGTYHHHNYQHAFGMGYKGNLYEMITFGGLTTPEIQQKTEGYLAWKHGLNTQLPTTHPYYNAKPEQFIVSTVAQAPPPAYAPRPYVVPTWNMRLATDGSQPHIRIIWPNNPNLISTYSTVVYANWGQRSIVDYGFTLRNQIYQINVAQGWPSTYTVSLIGRDLQGNSYSTNIHCEPFINYPYWNNYTISTTATTMTTWWTPHFLTDVSMFSNAYLTVYNMNTNSILSTYTKVTSPFTITGLPPSNGYTVWLSNRDPTYNYYEHYSVLPALTRKS